MSTKNPSLEDVRARRKQLADEDHELKHIEDGLVKLAASWASYTSHIIPNNAAIETLAKSNAPTGGDRPKKMTKNQMIIEALDAPRPLWQSAKQIQKLMTQMSGKEPPMSSVSPALTALKQSGTITRKDMLVALVLRLEKEEPDFLTENGEAAASPETGEARTSPIETQGRETGNG